MARIRTIKPEFFRHSELYRSEIETKFPLRVAYSGLWTACDREGRFKWKPEELKLDCLPYDDVDFSRVLDALWSRGFVEKYKHEERVYGYIPSWSEHQHINNREVASILPNPYESEILTRDGRVPDASEKLPSGKEGKGKEGKGKEYSSELIELNEGCKKYFDEKYINEKSLDCFDKLIRLDGYTIHQIQQAIIRGSRDTFWSQQFLSPIKLRTKDKAGVLHIDKFLNLKSNGSKQSVAERGQEIDAIVDAVYDKLGK
jgi:hypothetical protein